jgi:hypothetical protein
MDQPPSVSLIVPFRDAEKYGSAQQSVRKSNLRGFLESDVFAL